MIVRFRILFMVALAASCRLQAQPCTQADAAFPAVMRALGQGSVAGAEAIVRELPAGQRDCPSANLVLGRIEATKGHIEPARKAFEAYVRARPDDPSGRLDLARIQLLAGRSAEAGQNAEAAASRTEDSSLLTAAAQILQSVGAAGEAESVLLRAVELRPDERLLFQLGVFYDGRQQHQKAEAAFRRALGLNPSNAQAFDYLGLSLGPQGRMREAEEAFLQGLAVNRGPSFDSFLPYNYARLLAKLNRPEEALDHLNDATELAPDTRAVLYERAKVLANLGRREAARSDAEKALALADPANVVADSQVYYLLVRVCRELGDAAASSRYADRARKSPAARNTAGR